MVSNSGSDSDLAEAIRQLTAATAQNTDAISRLSEKMDEGFGKIGERLDVLESYIFARPEPPVRNGSGL